LSSEYGVSSQEAAGKTKIRLMKVLIYLHHDEIVGNQTRRQELTLASQRIEGRRKEENRERIACGFRFLRLPAEPPFV